MTMILKLRQVRLDSHLKSKKVIEPISKPTRNRHMKVMKMLLRQEDIIHVFYILNANLDSLCLLSYKVE